MSDLWLRHVRQEGLVVSRAALNDTPIEQSADDTQTYANCKNDFWEIASNILEWPNDRIARQKMRPTECVCRLTELNVTLNTEAAVITPNEDKPRLLIKILGSADPDLRGSVEGWSGVTPQQAFERHLRETRVAQGVLVTNEVIRLTYAPPGETPGFLEWPLSGMDTTAGRPMLSGLKLVLGKNALWGPEESRLDGVLQRSRELQNNVSTTLAEQVLGALYSLLRGFTAEMETRNALREVANEKPQQFYEGLLTVLLRLVFILYAEDRDLIPSANRPEAKTLYDRGYSIRALFGQLEEDKSLFPDTMIDRYGAWGRLLGLFKLVYDGTGKDFMHARRGKLFDPTIYPFLLGRFESDDALEVLPVSDACIHEVLTQLLILDGERLSYKTLDVEQIGSVYETVMGFTVERATGTSIALKVKPNSGSPAVPAFIDLEKILAKAPPQRKKFLADAIDYKVTDAQNKLLKPAKSVKDLLDALDKAIDERASPRKMACERESIILQPTDERRNSGSHYTPRALTGPIVRDALMPVLDQLGDKAYPEAILNLKICDPAMGSGAFLVETCRVLGDRLQQAWVQYPHLLPDEAKEDPQIFARREVAKRCLYGVDKNPMATDLGKLSLWLVTLARNEDFSFLDHALKTGDSLVGLTVDQIKGMTWESGPKDTETRKIFLFRGAFDKAVDKSLEERRSIRNAPDNVTFEIQKHHMAMADRELEGVRLAGDAVIGLFFSEPKATARKKALTDFQNSLVLGDEANWDIARQFRAKLRGGEHPIQPFHWEVEYPEVFAGENPGFDAMVGNPPFAGKNTVSGGQRAGYPDWMKEISPGAHGNADLVAHFFRRTYSMLRRKGTFGLIATNTIGQGDTRESGLRYLISDADGSIYRAKRRVKWPGAAAVVVSTVHMSKGSLPSNAPPQLDGKPVSRVSAFLREGDVDETPEKLKENEGIAFQGSIILGMGFTFDDKNAAKDKCEPLETMYRLIEKDPRNAERIKPYLGGEEVNNHPEHKHHRYVIDFEDFPLRREEGLISWDAVDDVSKKEMLRTGIVSKDYPDPVAADWPDLLEIVERRVKPERQKKTDSDAKKLWWRFLRRRTELIEARDNKEDLLILSRVSSNYGLTEIENTNIVFADSCVVITDPDFKPLLSSVHEIWARLLSSSLEDRLRYTPSDCFQSFTMPSNFRTHNALHCISGEYLSYRSSMMQVTRDGLTDTYNRFHNPLERSADITDLRRLHGELDDAVLRAYGWDDLAEMCTPGGEAAPRFLNEDDEPEFAYQKRLFWPAWFRDKVLARLLELNQERAAAEKQGTDEKMKSKKTQSDIQGSLL